MDWVYEEYLLIVSIWTTGRKGTPAEGEEPGEHEEVHGRAEEHDAEAEQEEGEAKEAARDPVAGDHDLHQKREALRH